MKKFFASILLATFCILTGHAGIAPVQMNPYTTNLVTAADAYARTAVASITNGLATTNYVKTIVSATNTANLIITTNLINTSIATATNGLASTNFVNTAIQAATNGLTGGGGGVTTNFVLTSISATNAANLVITTNLIVAATNQLASTNYVNSAVLSGGATTNFVLTSISATNAANLVITTNLVVAATNNFTTLVYTNPSAILYTSSLPGLTNGFVTSAITNGLAATNYVNAATNGLVTSAITNGLATTNFVIAATNGLVTSSITNGLATTNYVNAATNGLVTSSITNGLATTNYANSITNNFTSLVYTNPSAIVYTSSLPALTNGFVTASVTNGLATTNYAKSVTNNFTAIVYSNPAAYRLIGDTNFPGIYVTNTATIMGNIGIGIAPYLNPLIVALNIQGRIANSSGTLDLNQDIGVGPITGNNVNIQAESGYNGGDVTITAGGSQWGDGSGGDVTIAGGAGGTDDYDRNPAGKVILIAPDNGQGVPGASVTISGGGSGGNIVTVGPIYGNGVGLTNIAATNVIGLGTAAYSNATAFYLNSNPSHYVTSSVTNGLATTNYVISSIANKTNFPGIYVTNSAFIGYNLVQGHLVTASGDFSSAQGYSTTASGVASHAEGGGAVASGAYSHAEGYSTTASGAYSHAEGYSTTASGTASHAAGLQANAAHDYTWVWSDGNDGNPFSSTANNQFSVYAANGIRLLGGPIYGNGVGLTNIAATNLTGLGTAAYSNSTAFRLIGNTNFSGIYVTNSAYIGASIYVTNSAYIGTTLRQGYSVTASGAYSFAQGDSVTASGLGSHAEGSYTTASSDYAHAEGASTMANNVYTHAEGASTTASGAASHVEGSGAVASGAYSHAEGSGATASGQGSHAEGSATAAGNFSHAEGTYDTTANGWGSHAEGASTTDAAADYAHAEGYSTTASGPYSHSEGRATTASGAYSHAAGRNAKATNNNTWVWSDSRLFGSTTNSQFSVYATNGTRLLGGPIYGNDIVVSNNANIGGNITTTGSINATNADPAFKAYIDSQHIYLYSDLASGNIFSADTTGRDAGTVYINQLGVNNASPSPNNEGYAIDVNGTIANSVGNVQISGTPNQYDVSYSVNINGGAGANGYGGGSVNIQGGTETSGGPGGGYANLWGGDGIDSDGGSAYVRGGNVSTDGASAGNVLLSGGTGQSGSSASSITLNGTTAASQAGTISVTGDIITSLRVTGKLTNYVSNISTNTAPIYTSSANTGSYNINTIYTGPAQRSMLIGSIIFPASSSTDQGVTIMYTNNAVGYSLQIQYAHANSSGIGIYPFTIPLSTDATFQIKTNLGNTVTAIATNVVLWRL